MPQLVVDTGWNISFIAVS